MAADEASLQCLTKILTEFYSGSVDAERRASIHNVLMNYEQTPTAWYSALYYMYSTSEKFVALYSLGVIERTVLNRWSSISGDEKSELLRVLRFYIFERFAQQDSFFLAKKTAQVLSTMCCLDGVRCCALLVDDIKEYLLVSLEHQDHVKAITGLHALQIVLEQVSNPSELVGYSKKLELRQWMFNEAGVIYNLLLRVVFNLLGDHMLTGTATALQRSLSQDGKSGSSNAWDPVFQLTELLVTDSSEQSVHKCTAFLAWLECLSEAFKTLPLNSDSFVTFYNALLVFSLLGSPTFMSACTTYGDSFSSTSHSSPTSLLNRICLTSLGCIQEIVERKDLSFEVMRKHLFHVFPIVQCHLSLTTGEMAVPCSGTLAAQHVPLHNKTLSETVAADTHSQSTSTEYRLKIVDILKCLMTNIFCQTFDSVDSANAVGINPVRFLGLLHDFSFAMLNLDCYLSCLSLWNIFLEFLHMRYISNVDSQLLNTNKSTLPSDLHNPLFIFGKTLFMRLLHSEAANFLETLDEDVSEEGLEYMLSYCTDVGEKGDVMCAFRPDQPPGKSICEPCEYRVFLRETLTTFSLVLDLICEPLVSFVLERYHIAWNDYANLTQASGALSSDEFAFQPKGQPLHRVHWALRDFATITQAVGFIIDRISAVTSQSNDTTRVSAQDVLQSLLYCLQISRQLLPTVVSLKQSLIRSDLIQVIVQNLMTLQSIILGSHLSLQPNTPNETSNVSGKIVLSMEQKNVFLFEVMRVVEAFILPTVHGLPTVPLCIQLCSARLFCALCTSTIFTVFRAQDGDGSSDQFESLVQGNFIRIFGAVCDDNQRVLLHFDLLRLLLRTFVQCLSEGHVGEKSYLNDSLDRLISCLFLPYLTRGQLREAPLTHLMCLGLLNEAVDALESCSGPARRHVQSRLANSGLLEELVVCITSALNPDTIPTHPWASLVSVCTAYLTFFTTYIRVLSQSGSIGATIPELMGRVIRAIYATTIESDSTRIIPVVLIDRLLSMFLLIAKSRRIFVPLVGDIVDLCLYRFLPSLGHGAALDKEVDEESRMSSMVFAAGMHNPSSLRLLCELLFSTFLDGFAYFFETRAQSGNASAPTKSDLFVNVAQRYTLFKPDAFNRILFVLIAVFHERQVDSAVVTFVLEKFSALHRLRKFYELQAFNQYWLSELLRNLLTLLVRKHHDSCRDAILMASHELILSKISDSELSHVDKSTSSTSGSVFFVYHFLPAYLNTLPFLSETQRSNVLSPFYISHATGIPGSQIQGELVDLSDFSLFSRAVDQLVTDLRALYAENTPKLGVMSSGGQPETTMFDV